MTPRTAIGVLAAVAAAAVVLIGVEVVRGGSVHPVRVADPCMARPLPNLGGVDGVVQQVVLAGLDRAACRLRTSREALVLAIAGSSAGGGPHLDTATVTTAVRAGLRGSLHEAAQRGVVPSFAVPVLDRLIREAPIAKLVRGGFSLADLFGP